MGWVAPGGEGRTPNRYLDFASCTVLYCWRGEVEKSRWLGLCSRHCCARDGCCVRIVRVVRWQVWVGARALEEERGSCCNERCIVDAIRCVDIVVFVCQKVDVSSFCGASTFAAVERQCARTFLYTRLAKQYASALCFDCSSSFLLFPSTTKIPFDESLFPSVESIRRGRSSNMRACALTT